MAIKDELNALGATMRGKEFSQGDFSGSLKTLDGSSIDKGYCAGVVLDWTRRVLQSPVTRDKDYLSYAREEDEEGGEDRHASTLLRMVDAYAGQASTYIVKTEAQLMADELRRLAGQAEKAHEGLGTGVPVSAAAAKMMTLYWEIPGDEVNMFSRFRLDHDPSGVLTKAQVSALVRNLAQRIKNKGDRQTRPLATGGRHWKGFAKELDGKFAAIRALENRTVSKKPFSGIKVVRHKTLSSYATTGLWLREFLDIGLLPQCCTVVNVKRSLSDTGGHAIAIQVGMDGRYHLFDPNAGTFSGDLYTIKKCLQQLFWTSCFKPNRFCATNGNLAVYERIGLDPKESPPPVRDGWKAMGFTVFAKAVVAAPAQPPSSSA